MSPATVPARPGTRIVSHGLLVLFCLLMAGMAFGQDDKILTLPVRVHLLTGAGFQVEGTDIDLWLTGDDFTREVLPEINRIWLPAGVQWRMVSVTTEAAMKSQAAIAALAEIRQQAKEIGPAIRTLLPRPSAGRGNIVDLYLLPSIGAANGIAYPKDRIAVSGIWRTPGKRPHHRAPLVLTEPPYVSAAKTCAHELGHVLGLKHPDPGLKGRLMIAGPGLELIPTEIATARREAKDLCD